MVEIIHLETPFTQESNDLCFMVTPLQRDQIAIRYAPMSHDHIPGFPNKIPKVDWSRNLPMFKDDGKKDATLHLVRFHMHIAS